MKIAAQILLLFLLAQSLATSAQKKPPVVIPTDSTTQKRNPAFTKDTGLNIIRGDTIKTVSAHDPRKATLRSLMIPGWGQAYNREYWKIPIVYGVLGTLAGIFIYNNMWYKRSKYAYLVRVNIDTAHYRSIDPRLQVYSSAADLATIRNSFRQARDYSVLYFLLGWGLNVADATVFGHLKDFDVNENLNVRISPVLNTNGNAGFSLVMSYKNQRRVMPSVF